MPFLLLCHIEEQKRGVVQLNDNLTLSNYNALIHPYKYFEDSFDVSENTIYNGYVAADVFSPFFKLYCIRMFLEYQKYTELSEIITALPEIDTFELDCLCPNIEWFSCYGDTIFSSIQRFGWDLIPNILCKEHIYSIEDETSKEDTTVFSMVPLLNGCETLLSTANELLSDNSDSNYSIGISVLKNDMLGAYYRALNEHKLSLDSDTMELIEKLVREFNCLFSENCYYNAVLKLEDTYKIVYMEGYVEEVVYLFTQFTYLSLPLSAFWLNKILSELNDKYHFFQKGELNV